MRLFLALLVLAVLTTILHFSVFPFAGALHEAVNLPLALTFFLMTLRGFPAGVLFAVVLGVLFDRYALTLPGLWTVSLVGAVGVAQLLANRYVTHRSVFAIVLLMFLATLTWSALFWAGARLAALFDANAPLLTLSFFRQIPWYLATSTLFMIVLLGYLRRREAQAQLYQTRSFG